MVKNESGEEQVVSEVTGEPCPECGGLLKERTNKAGKTFVGCGNYPVCSYVKRDKYSFDGKPVQISHLSCPHCNEKMIIRTSKTGVPFHSCANFPKCKYTYNERK